MPDRTGESMRPVRWMRQTLISQLATMTGVVMLPGGPGWMNCQDGGVERGAGGENTNSHPEGWLFVPAVPGFSGGADGTRTRDLRRDRPAF